jgi:hypothetical protein
MSEHGAGLDGQAPPTDELANPRRRFTGPMLWATIGGAALWAAAVAGSIRWRWWPFMVSVLVETGAALVIIAASAKLSRRVLRPPITDSQSSGHTYAGPAHPRLAGRWLFGAVAAGAVLVAGAWAASRDEINEVWSSVLLEVGVATAMVGVLAVVYVLAVLAVIDTRYRPKDTGDRPKDTGDLCYRDVPPSPVRWVGTIQGPVYQCDHEPVHWYPALLADVPDLTEMSLIDMFLPGDPVRRLRAWRRRLRRAFHGDR